MAAISKEAKRKGLFQDTYTFDYVLKVTERHTHTRQVLSAHCLFYIYVGREHKPGETRIRQPTINSKDFKSDFFILGWEKDKYHLSLTDLLLEEIIQSKQYELLKSLI